MDTLKVALLYRGVLYVEVILYSKECNWYTRCCPLNGGVRYRECPLREAILYMYMYINTYKYMYMYMYLELRLFTNTFSLFSSRSLKQTYELAMLEEGEFDERVFLNSSETEHEEELLLGRSDDKNERYLYICTLTLYIN